MLASSNYTTLGKTISSDDSSRARGACVTRSTSPQQPLLLLGVRWPVAAKEEEAVEAGREPDEPDHRTTELGSAFSDSPRSLSAVQYHQ